MKFWQPRPKSVFEKVQNSSVVLLFLAILRFAVGVVAEIGFRWGSLLNSQQENRLFMMIGVNRLGNLFFEEMMPARGPQTTFYGIFVVQCL